MVFFLPSHLSSLQPGIARIHQILLNYKEAKQNQPSPPPAFRPSPPLSILCQQFNLSPFDLDILLLCLAVELDPDFYQLIPYPSPNSNHVYPTLSLALSAFPDASYSVLSPLHPLHYWQLINISPSYCISVSPVRLDQHILCFILGDDSLDEQLLGFVSPIPPTSSFCTLSSTHEVLVELLVDSWSAPSHLSPLLQLSGGDSTAKYRIAFETSCRLGANLRVMSVASIPQNPQKLQQLKKRWEREALLRNCILLLDCDQLSAKDSFCDLLFSQFLENIITPVIISSREPLETKHRPLLSFDVSPLGYTEQKTIWLTNLGPLANNLDGQIDRLASQFNLSTSAIQTACLQYKNQTQQAEDSPNPDLLWDYCRNQARLQLDDLAQRLDSTVTWSDLVLPAQQYQILEDITNHLKHRAKVYQDWGFSGKGSRGLGLCALFHGESGTGKTLAAEVLANHFRLDLYCIDLSAVVSKYVGETEKNLRRIFDAAESGGAILLFDEADALFGKRTEVNDSRDRYANVEISYLLQRMEAYRGLAILTTNRKEDIDTAFLRRIRFAVTFPFPDASSRTEIWRRIFPPQTPTEGLNYRKLGQLKIAGGNIRNIALNAAFLAAEAEEPVMMKHILTGAEREYLKLKRLLTDEETRGWSC